MRCHGNKNLKERESAGSRTRIDGLSQFQSSAIELKASTSASLLYGGTGGAEDSFIPLQAGRTLADRWFGWSGIPMGGEPSDKNWRQTAKKTSRGRSHGKCKLSCNKSHSSQLDARECHSRFSLVSCEDARCGNATRGWLLLEHGRGK